MKTTFWSSSNSATSHGLPWRFPLFRVMAFLLLSTMLRAILRGPATRAVQQAVKRRRGGAIASEDNECTRIGVQILTKGGNAADALVSTTLCVGVTGMYHSGIGGGGFMIVRDADGSKEVIDFRETAPSQAHQNMYSGNLMGSLLGGLSSGIPGELRGLEYLHRKYGKLPWKDICMPAVNLAREGFRVTEDLAFAIDAIRDGATFRQGLAKEYQADYGSAETFFLLDDPSWSVDFAPYGNLVRANDIMTRKRYASTLESIALQGVDAFYKGPIAKATVEAIRNTNGIMTLEDLRSYKVVIREPSHITYRGYNVYASPAPSSGTIALGILKTVEGFPMNDPTIFDLNTHRLNEAVRHAFGARAELGDPRYLSGIKTYENYLISEKRAANIRTKISDYTTKFFTDYNPKGLEITESGGTSHIVAADATGLSISLTSTINKNFGSRVVVPETGVILNNGMGDCSIPNTPNVFGFQPSASNFIHPGKRCMSSSTPIIVENADHSFLVALGSAGGSKIITTTVQNLWHILDRGSGIMEAFRQPRWHDQLMPDVMLFEHNYNNGTTKEMKKRGHNISWMREGLSAAQGIMRSSTGIFEAAGEPRQKNSGGLVL